MIDTMEGIQNKYSFMTKKRGEKGGRSDEK